MLAIENFDNITNSAAVEFLRKLRNDYSGVSKVYGTRYLAALAKVCGYTVTNYGKTLILGPANATRKEFKANKEAGQFMEGTIQDLIGFGIIAA